MITHYFSVRDNVAQAFLPLFGLRSNGEAIRSFTDAVNDPKHQFHPHAADYVLYLVCSFNDENGEVVANSSGPVKLVTGADVIQRDVSPR